MQSIRPGGYCRELGVRVNNNYLKVLTKHTNFTLKKCVKIMPINILICQNSRTIIQLCLYANIVTKPDEGLTKNYSIWRVNIILDVAGMIIDVTRINIISYMQTQIFIS